MVASIRSQLSKRNLSALGLLGAVVFYLTGCGSGGQNDRIDRTPTIASFSVAEATVIEGNELQVEVSLSPPVQRDVWVSLSAVGSSAERDIDYELSESIVRFRRLNSTARTTIRVFDDWLAESDEFFTIGMAGFSQYVTAGLQSTVRVTIEDDGDLPLNAVTKAGMADLFVSARASFSAVSATLDIRVFNGGSRDASETTARVRVFELNSPGTAGSERIRQSGIFIPPIDSNGGYTTQVDLSLLELHPSATYWAEVYVREPEEEQSDLDALPNSDYLGFTLDRQGEILVTCQSPGRIRSSEGGDPLFEYQWGLQNTEQRAFSRGSGTEGEDLNMDGVLESGSPTGREVKVAVVDTGLEICHPDLEANVPPGESFNFRVWAFEDSWHNAVDDDPFFPDSRGGHGTSVAGIIGAVADNGLGTRGVAPDVELFGFNYLSYQCCEEDALGGSESYPNSAQIDIFNMSYGSLGSQYNEPFDSILKHGTTHLRDGLGALYVKAAGNGFNRCSNFRHQVHTEVGCTGSNGDALGDTPYVINVAALNAEGHKASYSSTGSNLWVAAPSGEYGVSHPATLTTDQFDRIRGYSSRGWPGIENDPDENPFGDYTSNFNGTSAAAPHVTGVVALLLEEEPELTWRDVKHVLANTSRRPGRLFRLINDVEVMINGEVATIQRDWTRNGAGYEFHNHFGFGAVDVDAALSYIRRGFATDQLGEQTETDWISGSQENVEIPDHFGGGVELTVNVELPAAANIEAVLVRVEGYHANLGDLTLELVSPRGTPSIVNTVFNGVLIGSNHLEWNLLSNAFYGESPRGEWRLRVIDVAEDDTGVLDRWSLRFWYGDHP